MQILKFNILLDTLLGILSEEKMDINSKKILFRRYYQEATGYVDSTVYRFLKREEISYDQKFVCVKYFKEQFMKQYNNNEKVIKNIIYDRLSNYSKINTIEHTSMNISDFLEKIFDVVCKDKISTNRLKSMQPINRKKELNQKLITNLNELNLITMIIKNSKKYYNRLVRIENAFGNKINNDIFCNIYNESEKITYKNTLQCSPIIQLLNNLNSDIFPNAFIYGDGGMGKTTSLKYLWNHILQSEEKTIPIYIKLNSYNRLTKSQKHSFITDYFMNSYLDLKYSKKLTSNLLEIIEHILEFDNQTNQYKIVLLLDGFNEVTLNKEILTNQIYELSTKSNLINVIITSRNLPKFFGSTLNTYSINKMLFLEEEVIKTVKPNNHFEVELTLLKNPMMLCLYKNINDVLNSYPSYSRYLKNTISSEGELIWNYIQVNVLKFIEITSFSSNFMRDNVKTVMYLILPAIGFEMNKNGVFHASKVELIKIVTEYLVSFIKNDHFDYFGYYDEKLTRIDWQEIAQIRNHSKEYVRMLIEDLVLLREAENKTDLMNEYYEFQHHIFRDFFAANNVLNEMNISVRSKKIGTLFKKEYFNYHVKKYVGEIIGEHYKTAEYLEKDHPLARKENIISWYLDLCRGVYDKSLGNTVFNIIEIIKTSKGNLINCDFRDLDLTLINLVGIKCSENGQFPSKFNGSILHDSCIMPQGHLGPVVNLDLNENTNKMITGSIDKKIIEWDLISKSKIGEYNLHSDLVWAVKYNKDATRIISGSHNGEIIEWNTSNCSIIRTYDDYKVKVFDVCFSPGGDRFLSCHADGTVIEWSCENGDIIQKYNAHDTEVLSANYNSIGDRFITGSSDTFIKEWNCETGDLIMTYEGHTSNVTSVNYDEENKTILSASDDGTIKEWKVGFHDFKQEYKLKNVTVTSATYNKNETKILSTTSDKEIIEWSRGENEILAIYRGHTNSVYDAKYYKNESMIVSISHDSTIKEWDVKNKECIRTYDSFSNYILDIKYMINRNKILTSAFDGTIKVWNLARIEMEKCYNLDSKAVTCLDYADSLNKCIAGTYEGLVKEYCLDSDKNHIITLNHTSPVTVVRYRDNHNVILSCSTLCKIFEYNRVSKKIVKFKSNFKNLCRINDCEYSKDEMYLYVAADDGLLYKWDVFTGSLLKKIEVSSCKLRSIKIISDEIIIIGDEQGAVHRLINDRTNKIFKFEDSPIRKILYKQLEQSILIGYYNSNIIEVSIADMKFMKKYEGHSISIRSLDFFDGTMYSCSYDNTLKIWNSNEFVSILDISGQNLLNCSFQNLHVKSDISDLTRGTYKKFNVSID